MATKIEKPNLEDGDFEILEGLSWNDLTLLPHTKKTAIFTIKSIGNGSEGRMPCAFYHLNLMDFNEGKKHIAFTGRFKSGVRVRGYYDAGSKERVKGWAQRWEKEDEEKEKKEALEKQTKLLLLGAKIQKMYNLGICMNEIEGTIIISIWDAHKCGRVRRDVSIATINQICEKLTHIGIEYTTENSNDIPETPLYISSIIINFNHP